MKPVLLTAVLLVSFGCSASRNSVSPIPAFEGDPIRASVQDGAAPGTPVPASAPAPAMQPAKPAEKEYTGGRVTLLLGGRSLDEDFWQPLEDQGVLGLEVSLEKPGSAVGWELGIMGSGDSDDIGPVDVDASTLEFYGGVRKTFGEPGPGIHPYLGAGLSFIGARVEGGSVSEDDSSLAVYAHGGVLGQISESFFIGADLRALFGSDIDFGSVSGDVDYTQIGIVLGWAF